MIFHDNINIAAGFADRNNTFFYHIIKISRDKTFTVTVWNIFLIPVIKSKIQLYRIISVFHCIFTDICVFFCGTSWPYIFIPAKLKL